MLKDYLLQSCQTQYERSCAGHCGQACDNHEFCKGTCDARDGCLDQVHWYPQKNGRSDYNCEHLLQKYALLFTERYEEQIINALQYIDENRYDRYNILSIGCGGTPDLMAFETITRDAGKIISYHGYDRNLNWKSIHDDILRYSQGNDRMDVHLTRVDIFDIFECGFIVPFSCNVIIIQYLISHLFNTGQNQRISELFDYLINDVLPTRNPRTPFLFIICDVDSVNKGRPTWFTLLDKLEQNGYHGRAYARSFYPNGDLGRERWSHCKGSPNYRNINYHYVQNHNDYDGAQLVIELE